MSQKVFIIGAAGMVGSSCAYNILVKELAKEIILIDIDKERLEGQFSDLFHAASFTKNTKVKIGDYNEINNNDIVVITAGKNQVPGQTRLDLKEVNEEVILKIMEQINSTGKNIFIVIVSNPVDILTYTALKNSKLSKERVFGSGTCTDTARLKAYLAKKFNVEYSDVDAMVLGEHGESCFIPFSQIRIKGELINDLDQEEVNQYIKNAASKIISAKGSTYYGIASVVGNIIDALGNSKEKIIPVCSLAEGEFGLNNIVIGLPNVINSSGVKIVENIELNNSEKDLLNSSSKVLENYLD